MEYKLSKEKKYDPTDADEQKNQRLQQNDIVQQKNEYQEEIENTKEDQEINGKLILTKHHRRAKRNQEGGVGTAEALTTTREIVQA